ncbi:MAG: nitrate reductase molybdenum cofactor assembly chaperone [Rhodobacteraceae bacterium]|nr:MAG: nitrate reductase molybdenum cofactor assembly chaperone [Paracoccaceae bacterium]
MSVTFKALSVLLSYPSDDLKAAVGEIREIITSEGILSKDAVAAIQPLLTDMEKFDKYELQERFVLLFDRSRTLSLNLFEHVHGESRDRGPAMVDLLETYRAGGFDLVSTELPDHLPILLEFLSNRPIDEAKEMLEDAGHIMAALAERLHRRESNYAAVLAALAEFAGAEASSEMVQELLSVKDDDPEDLEALDDVWEEAEITFGPDPEAGCPVSRDILANMDIPKNTQPAAAMNE